MENNTRQIPLSSFSLRTVSRRTNCNQYDSSYIGCENVAEVNEDKNAAGTSAAGLSHHDASSECAHVSMKWQRQLATDHERTRGVGVPHQCPRKVTKEQSGLGGVVTGLRNATDSCHQ